VKTPGQILYEAMYPKNGDWDVMTDELRRFYERGAQAVMEFYETGKDGEK
jgi:hypothetical protein